MPKDSSYEEFHVSITLLVTSSLKHEILH